LRVRTGGGPTPSSRADDFGLSGDADISWTSFRPEPGDVSAAAALARRRGRTDALRPGAAARRSFLVVGIRIPHRAERIRARTLRDVWTRRSIRVVGGVALDDSRRLSRWFRSRQVRTTGETARCRRRGIPGGARRTMDKLTDAALPPARGAAVAER